MGTSKFYLIEVTYMEEKFKVIKLLNGVTSDNFKLKAVEILLSDIIETRFTKPVNMETLTRLKEPFLEDLEFSDSKPPSQAGRRFSSLPM